MAGNNFGISLSEEFIHLAYAEEKKDKIELLSYGYENLPATFFTNLTGQVAQETAKTINYLYDKLNLGIKRVNIVLPDHFTYSQLLIMPDLPEDQLVKSIKLQADEFIPLPISEVYIDIEVITKLPNGKLLLLFIASRKNIVDHIFNTVTLAGLEAETLENELSSVGRFMSEYFKFIHEPSLVINLGNSSSSIYVVNPDFPFFQITRTSRIGYDVILRDLKVNSNLGEKSAEALKTIGLNPKGSININAIVYPVLSELFNDVQKTILLAKERYNVSIKHIYLMNNDYKIAWLIESTQNKLLLPTQSLPLSTVLTPNSITQAFSQTLSSCLPVISTQIR